MASLEVVLGIPIPQCVRKLPCTPPACFPSPGDVLAIELLRGFGLGLGARDAEITQACNLASGFSDVIVILQRPRATAYRTTFENFVRKCPTLNALDELIRFATKGTRSIHTVTVLDAFSFQEEKYASDQKWSKKCHQLLAQILRAKKPKVVILCHLDKYKDPWMKRFELTDKKLHLVRKEVEIDDTHKTVAIQSFHPAIAVNNAGCRPEYRALLIHHFVAAFAELSGKFDLPPYVDDLQALCDKPGRGAKEPALTRWEAADFIHRALTTPYDGPQSLHGWNPRNRKPFDELQRRIEAFNDMYHGLRRLAAHTFDCGGLSIAVIVLFFWGRQFKPEDEPLYQQIVFLLLLRGNEQSGWLAKSASDDITDKALAQQEEHAPFCVSVLADRVRLVFERDETTIQVVSVTVFEPEPADDMPSKTRELVKAMSERCQLLKECLRHSPLADFENSIQVAALTRQLDLFLEMKITERCLTEEGKLQTKADMADCFSFLMMLHKILKKYQPNSRFADNKREFTRPLVPPSRPQTPTRKKSGLLTPETMHTTLNTTEVSPGSTTPKRSYVENKEIDPPTPTKRSRIEPGPLISPEISTEQRLNVQDKHSSTPLTDQSQKADAYKAALSGLKSAGMFLDRQGLRELHELINTQARFIVPCRLSQLSSSKADNEQP